MRLINLTPHPVHIVGKTGEVLATFKVEGAPARCREVRDCRTTVVVGSAEIPLVRTHYGEIKDLPPVQEGTIYIVALVVAQVAKAMGRSDVVYPGDVVRDLEGTIIGCHSLSWT